MLAKNYDGQDVTGWLMSEKLDGVRAIWDGNKLLSRNGNKFNAPKWFTDLLPKGEILDGELYISRGKFQATVGIVRKKKPIDEEWEKISYQVFDAPLHPGGFESRLEYCRELLRDCSITKVVEHVVCNSIYCFEKFYEKLCEVGAEGIILRRAGSKYEHKRSYNLLKYKPTITDEAKVIEYQKGKGKYIGMIGALICKWKDKIIEIGSGLNDEQRLVPPAIGTFITFEFKGLTDSGMPRFPIFVSVRDYE